MLGAFVASLGMSRSASTSILERYSKKLCHFSNKQYDQAPRAHSSNRKKEWYVEEDENGLGNLPKKRAHSDELRTAVRLEKRDYQSIATDYTPLVE
jgi:hypothetical protein